jgi:hypothetical protein
MKNLKQFFVNRQFVEVILFAGALSLMASRADAYIDPATGLVVWQAIFAAIGGILMFVRNPIKFIKNIFDRIRNRKNSK